MIFLTTMTTEELLQEWGNWSIGGLGLTLHSPSEPAFVKIDEDTALVIDRAVAQLGYPKYQCKKRNRAKKLQQLAVMMYYKNNLPYEFIGQNLDVGETKARTLVLSGVEWVDGYLEGEREKLAA